MTVPNEMQRVPLHKGQQIGVALLGILSVGILLVAVLQFKTGLYANATRTGGTEKTQDPEAQQKAEIERLKHTDTDHDGLSDYDEIYIYHTSPYLWSTTGDGISDGEKVRRGLDPLCPIGKDCSINPLYVAPKKDTASSTPFGVSAAPTTVPSVGVGAASDIQKIRDMLLQSGIKKEQLDQLTDDELMQLVIQAQQKVTSTKP